MQLSFLIQKSSDQRLFASFPRHIAGYHVFRRLSMPRHPPYTLSSLTKFIDHRQRKRRTTISECRTFVRHLALVIWHSHDRACRTAVGHRNSQPIDTMDHIFAKKVLDDTHPTKRLPWGSRQCRGEHRGGSCVFHSRLKDMSGHQDLFTLNLTYLLVKELLLIHQGLWPGCFDRFSAKGGSVCRRNGILIQFRQMSIRRQLKSVFWISHRLPGDFQL